jgi:hypothetical protein
MTTESKYKLMKDPEDLDLNSRSQSLITKSIEVIPDMKGAIKARVFGVMAQSDAVIGKIPFSLWKRAAYELDCRANEKKIRREVADSMWIILEFIQDQVKTIIADETFGSEETGFRKLLRQAKLVSKPSDLDLSTPSQVEITGMLNEHPINILKMSNNLFSVAGESVDVLRQVPLEVWHRLVFECAQSAKTDPEFKRDLDIVWVYVDYIQKGIRLSINLPQSQ